jgi:hypothetical protein
VPIIEAPYLLVISPSPEFSAAANSASPARWTSAVGAAGLNATAGMDRGAGATLGPGVRATGAEPPVGVRDADLADGGLGGAGCAGAAAASAERAGARVAASVTWNELNQAVHVHGLATTGGVVSTTGIAGLTLGGGVGWIMGKHARFALHQARQPSDSVTGRLVNAVSWR